MNISETNSIEAVKKSTPIIILRNKSIKKYNNGVKFRNFLRRH